MKTKICNQCKRELPETNEYFSCRIKPNEILKYIACCKSCCAAKKRQKRKDNPEHERMIDRQRHQRDHNKRLNLMRQYNQNNRDEINIQNAERRMEMKDEYNANRRLKYADNPELILSRTRDLRKKYPERYSVYGKNNDAKRKMAEGFYTLQDELYQLSKQNHRCFWCRIKLEGKKYHIDHIIPISRGGTNWSGNIVISCPHCNMSKGNKLPFIEWQPFNPFVFD